MNQTKNYYFLKALLVFQTIGVLTYTLIVFQHDGINFLARAYEYIVSLSWSGQFILDFNCYLLLSALWIAWRSKFSAQAVLIAIIAMILGIIVFAPYFLYLVTKENGELNKVLIGER